MLVRTGSVPAIGRIEARKPYQGVPYHMARGGRAGGSVYLGHKGDGKGGTTLMGWNRIFGHKVKVK